MAKKKKASAKVYKARRRRAMVLGVGAAALKGALAFVGGKAAAAVGKGIAAMAMNPGKQIDPNMVAITLHRNSYPTRLARTRSPCCAVACAE